MRILIQVVQKAEVAINKKIMGSINRGFCVFVGFCSSDNTLIVDKMIDKMVNARLFLDENGKTNLSINAVNGEILSISQFTLYGSLKDGRRPSFIEALEPIKANELYEYFNSKLRSLGYKISTGVFGADMKISLINDGPFTIMLDSKELIK